VRLLVCYLNKLQNAQCNGTDNLIELLCSSVEWMELLQDAYKGKILHQISIILEDFLEQMINCTHCSKDLHLGVGDVKIKLSQLCRIFIILLVTTRQILQHRIFLNIFPRFSFRYAIEPVECRVVARPLDGPSSVYVSVTPVYVCSKSDRYSKIFDMALINCIYK